MPSRRARTLVSAVLLWGACRPAAPPPAPAPPPPAPLMLAWSMPAPTVATYQVADTSRVSVQAGPAGNVDVDIQLSGTAEMRLEQNGDSVRVTAQMTAFDGSFKNSMGPTMAIGKEDVAGTVILSVDPHGAFNIVQRSEGSARLRQVASIEALYRNFVVRLPASAVTVGITWTDTITASEVREGVTSSIRSILTSTYAGDTSVAGRTLRVIRSDATNNLEISGSAQGTPLVQKMEGASNITTLWDSERKLLVERHETGSLRGGMDMPSMGMSALPVSATSRRVYRLVTPQ
jgi:hypothetical protein